ncbi:MAG: 4Fe-4S dicluster domain-containing protein [Pararhodobacter sp.]|nr:4Fe-4S dicluster domain-containing protein [Pararhodobacter sp.]
MVKLPKNWQPDPEQMALWPDVSGNDINGLDEAVFRRPRHVYWASEPDSIAHGAVQRWFYRRNDNPAFARERAIRAEVQARKLPDLAQVPAPGSPGEWSARIKAEAALLGAEAVGIARIRPEWAFEGHEIGWCFIVVLGIAMDYDTMQAAPEQEAGIEVVRQYTRGAEISKRLAGWLREQGHDAAPEHGPMAGEMVLLPAAIAAGMGELGKHGSLIHRELGSCFRLAGVLTDMELAPDAPDEFGADGFCTNCRICADHCPPMAILPEKQTVRGVQKWYVDFDRCLPFFNETAGCGICVAVCPFSRPGVGANLVAKLARRRERESREGAEGAVKAG